VAGSRSGIGGTSTSPAPRLPRLDRLLVPRREPRLVDRLPVGDDGPEAADDREPGPDRPDGPDPPDGPDGPERPDGPVVAGLAAEAATAGAVAAAIPHTLQYPSSIVPVHPGVRAQDVTGTPAVVPDG
jgi:hypothetical protein